MNNAFYIGAAGLRAQQTGVDVVANNIANINTTSYKRASVRFAEMVAAPSSQRSTMPDGSINPQAASAMFGVSANASSRVFSQGDLRQTNNPLDLAIRGDGFVELMAPGGQTMLWRGGTLTINQDGFLAAPNGMPLKSMLSVPRDATNLTIDQSGKVSAVTDGQQAAQDIGQIDLVVYRDANALTDVGDGLYRTADDARPTVHGKAGEEGAGVFVQGSAEASNITLSDEMVNLLLMQRAYAASARVVQAGDELMNIANGLRR